MSKDLKYFCDGSDPSKFSLSFQPNKLYECLKEIEEKYLLLIEGEWYVPKVAFSEGKAFKKIQNMTAGETGYKQFPNVDAKNVTLIDDEKPFFFKRDAIVKGIKRVPPRLYFLIKRLIEGDISAYFELLDYGNHIDLVPYKDRCDFLKSKEEECISYQSLRDKMQYIEKWMRTYAISCDNAGYDFKGLRDLYESVLSLVEVQNVDRDIAKAYVKKMENN